MSMTLSITSSNDQDIKHQIKQIANNMDPDLTAHFASMIKSNWSALILNIIEADLV